MPTKPPGTPDIDITDPFSFGVIDDVVFMTSQVQPSGTGVFDSFLRIQDNGTEQGYNTDASPQYDEKDAHTNSILLADIPIIIGDGTNGTIEGVAYREFLLDIGEGGNGRYLSLDSLQIWQQESGNLTNFTPGTGFAGTHTNYLAYDLDAGGDRWIALSDQGGGSGQSDYRILIPDSFFINDADHRYVTLYSEFGRQPGWGSDGSFEEWGLSNENGGVRSAVSVQKIATVDGGTADTVGEIINYSLSVSNTGNTALSGLTVVDPSVSDLAAVLNGTFNIGDTNQDNLLSAGETWRYTASHTVTQDDLDTNGGGDGVIQNTVTVDTTETAPVAASAAIQVDSRPLVNITKTTTTTSVNAAGDVVNYTIAVENIGNVTLTNPFVTDSQVNIVTPVLDFNAPVLDGPDADSDPDLERLAPILVGDYNIGDTNENGIEDPGETFEFANLGDLNQNGEEDPGETFEYANIGDTNQNGFQDEGETFEFYNIGDANQNGVEDPGEIFQFDVDHRATAVDANNDGRNDGDTNLDGRLDVSEVWQYTVTYTVTQDDIDNGGIVDPALTHDNTANVETDQNATDHATASVAILQNPDLAVTKVADVSAVDGEGDKINYTITVTNNGNMTLTDVVVSDSLVGLTLTSGDDSDGVLNLGETWTYTGTYTVTQADMDAGLDIVNTASADSSQTDPADDDIATQTVDVIQNPHVTLVKDATVPGGTADVAGEVIDYTIAVTNDGNVTLTNVDISDPFVSDLAAVETSGFNVGDLDSDGALDVNETWQYTASHMVTEAEISGGGTIDNTASVTTDQGASGSEGSSVVIGPALTLSFETSMYIDSGENGLDSNDDLIQFVYKITNSGTDSLSNVSLSDILSGAIGAPDGGDVNLNGLLDGGESWIYSENYFLTAGDVTAGVVHNEATLTGLDPLNQPIIVTGQIDIDLTP